MKNNLMDEARELWAVYAWWSCILVLKMNAMTWVTGRVRVSKRVLHSEEDRMWLEGSDVIVCPTGGGHEDVDRVRSAHQHDLGTVLPYLLIAPIWLNTSPLFPVARLIPPCFTIVSISYTLLHMKTINVHRYCKTILSALELGILVCMSTMIFLHYLF